MAGVLSSLSAISPFHMLPILPGGVEKQVFAKRTLCIPLEREKLAFCSSGGGGGFDKNVMFVEHMDKLLDFMLSI